MPTSSNTMNAGADFGAMPANESVNMRPMVTAGLAKLVDDVNQYAAPMYAPTANGAALDRPVRTTPKITKSSPSVATISPSHRPPPERTSVDHSTPPRSNMRLAM